MTSKRPAFAAVMLVRAKGSHISMLPSVPRHLSFHPTLKEAAAALRIAFAKGRRGDVVGICNVDAGGICWSLADAINGTQRSDYEGNTMPPALRSFLSKILTEAE